jgi:hypothetical protein
MLRIICRTDDAGMAANVGGSVCTEHRTFDVELPELEAWLREPQGTYGHRQVTGVELVGSLEPVPQPEIMPVESVHDAAPGEQLFKDSNSSTYRDPGPALDDDLPF